MAACDYFLCTWCGAKTFYDADLGYEDRPPVYEGRLMPCGVGKMIVLCEECAKTYDVAIVPNDYLAQLRKDATQWDRMKHLLSPGEFDELMCCLAEKEG